MSAGVWRWTRISQMQHRDRSHCRRSQYARGGQQLRVRHRFHLACIALMTPVVRVDRDFCDADAFGTRSYNDADLLLQKLFGEKGDTRVMSIRTVDGRDETQFDWIAADAEYDRDSCRRHFRRRCRGPTQRSNDCHPTLHQLRRQSPNSPYAQSAAAQIFTLLPSIWPSSFMPARNALTHLAPALLRMPAIGIAGCCTIAIGHAPAPPSSANELAPPHSITSSARASSVGGCQSRTPSQSRG